MSDWRTDLMSEVAADDACAEAAVLGPPPPAAPAGAQSAEMNACLAEEAAEQAAEQGVVGPQMVGYDARGRLTDVHPLSGPALQADGVAAAQVARGPGEVSRRVVGPFLELRLWNFGIDGAALKPEHTAALQRDRSAVTVGEVEIEGTASRSGSEKHNAGVSAARAHAAAAALLAMGLAPERLRRCEGTGEAAGVDGSEESLHRAVVVRVKLPEGWSDKMAPPAPVADDEERYVPGKGELANGFHRRSRPINFFMWEMLKTHRDLDDKLRQQNREQLGMVAVKTIPAATSSGIAGRLGQFVDILLAYDSFDASALSSSKDAALEKALDVFWEHYQWDLAHQGQGFDHRYQIVDRAGNVVDRRWAERMGK